MVDVIASFEIWTRSPKERLPLDLTLTLRLLSNIKFSMILVSILRFRTPSFVVVIGI